MLPYINADPALARRLAGDWDAHRHAAGLAHRQRAGAEDARTRSRSSSNRRPCRWWWTPASASRRRRRRRWSWARTACLINTAIARAADPAQMARGDAHGGGGGPQGISERAGCPSCPIASRQQPDWKASSGDEPFPQPCLMLVTEPSPRLPQIVGRGCGRWRGQRGAAGGKTGPQSAWGTTDALRRSGCQALKERAPS